MQMEADESELIKPKNSLQIGRPSGDECGKRQLYQYLRFYQVYPQIVRSLPAQLRHLIREGPNVEYALAGMDNNLFVSKYLLELSKKEEMRNFY